MKVVQEALFFFLNKAQFYAPPTMIFYLFDIIHANCLWWERDVYDLLSSNDIDGIGFLIPICRFAAWYNDLWKFSGFLSVITE